MSGSIPSTTEAVDDDYQRFVNSLRAWLEENPDVGELEEVMPGNPAVFGFSLAIPDGDLPISLQVNITP